jgi:hypothetical protein
MRSYTELDNFYTIPEAAKIIHKISGVHISRGSLHFQVSQGNLEAIRKGRYFFIYEKDIINFAKEYQGFKHGPKKTK